LNANGRLKWSVHFGGRTTDNSVTIKTWSKYIFLNYNRWHQQVFIVLGCLSKCGGIIEEIHGKFDSAAYEKLLDKYVSKMSGLQPRIFLQDNFPVHLAPRIDSWFSKNNAFNVIRLP
jgi:hypothetical protein